MSDISFQSRWRSVGLVTWKPLFFRGQLQAKRQREKHWPNQANCWCQVLGIPNDQVLIQARFTSLIIMFCWRWHISLHKSFANSYGAAVDRKKHSYLYRVSWIIVLSWTLAHEKLFLVSRSSRQNPLTNFCLLWNKLKCYFCW